jgi:CheY-like chemotaxis protein
VSNRILVVDNDPNVLELLEAILTTEGYPVTCWMDPHAVLREIEVDPPDLLISDVMMPTMTGLELVDRLRSHGYTGPCLLLSALATRAVADAATAHGATAFLPKPLRIAELLIWVGRLVGGRIPGRDDLAPATGVRPHASRIEETMTVDKTVVSATIEGDGYPIRAAFERAEIHGYADHAPDRG